MPEFEYDTVERRKRKGGCQCWQVAIICSLLIAIGLGVGLGVGLSNQKTVIVTETSTVPDKSTTTKSDQTTTMSETTTHLGVITSAGTAPTTASIPDSGPWTNYRLPEYIIPFHYQLTLHPNMSTDMYTGTNGMSFRISQNTKYILVHADAKLEILSTKLERYSDDGNLLETITIAKEFRVPIYEYYVTEAENMLTPNTGNGYYKLTMDFQSSLVGRIVGLYKSVYTDSTDGTEKAMVGSDMEPTDARKAYPCFDEPAMKIRYTTTLVHEPHHIALSNMDVMRNESRNDGLIATIFRESVPMSTYLACFAVSEFVFLEQFSQRNNIPLRVYIPKHQLDAGQADYAIEVMKIEFDFLENYFGMNYSLPKLDMISIPNFGTGAMENWGLITYRETNLLWDPKESSTSNKQRVAAVISHELVHQWFGNIVTMKWWDNIWLNEGFASFFEYYGIEAAESDWQILDHFVIDDLQRAMRSDDTITSHPVVVNVTTPGQITSVFDTISYSKGATVLRIMRDLLGNITFIEGIKYYLQKRQFSNADEQDFFSDVQEYVDSTNQSVNIAAIMNPWVLQMGYPVINVKTTAASQEHFLTDPNADLNLRPPSQFDYEWNVDIKFYTKNNSAIMTSRLEIGKTDIQLNTGVLATDDWIKLNPDEIGYYRVNYDSEMWETISNQLTTDFSVFSELDRSNLIDDGFNLAPAKLISYTQALNLTRYMDKEESYFVWDAFSSGSSYIRIMLENTPVYPNFQAYYKNKVKPIADKLTWNATLGTHVEKLNRYLVLALALRYGDDDALDNATMLFSNWIADESYYLYPDIRQLVYRYGNPNTTEWEMMLQRYLTESVASEKTNLLRGLTSTENVGLIDRMLEYSKNESIILSQDFFTCITYISYTITGNKMAWTWVQLNWEYMVERFGLDDRNLGRLVPNIVSDFNTNLKLWEVVSFFEKYPESGAGESGRASALNSIETNIKWMEENQEEIDGWFKDQL